MNIKEIREQKLTLKLTDRQRAIIVGLLLGDGHLETQNQGRTYRLKVEHGESQGDYVQWLFRELRDWIPAREPYIKIRSDGTRNVGFNTYSHGSLRYYGHQFYADGRKQLPAIIHKMIKPISIAVWFMDDGSRKSAHHHTYILHTLGYTRSELERAQIMFERKFGIKVVLHKQKGKYWRLYIRSESAKVFETLVGEYVQPIVSMKHKLVTHIA